MLGWLAGSCMRFRGLVVVVAAATLVFGIVKLRDEPVDVLPEYGAPTVEVQTEALGLSAAEVEQLITVPMEQDLLNGIAFLKDIRSQSVPGLSRILLVFEPGTDIYLARQGVAERLSQAHALPQVSKPPQMLQPVSSENRVAHGGDFLEDALRDQDVRARAVDDRSAPPRRPRRRQRQHLGPARPAGPGAGRARAPAGRRRLAQPSPGDNRQRALVLAAHVRRGVDARHGRLHRHGQPAPRDPTRVADHHRRHTRRGAARGHARQAHSPQRCRLGRRGPPAAHRGRDRERRRGTHPRDREVPAGERDGRHARSGRGDRLDATRPRRRRLRHDDLPTGVLDRAVDRQPHPGAHSRRRAPRARVCRLLLPVAQRACRPRSRPRVGRLGRARAGGAGQDDERNGACGPRRGARRRHRRRGRRRRQHCPALTRAPGWG